VADFNDFLRGKIGDIGIALASHNNDMFDMIGSVRDVFSSAYDTRIIAESDVVEELWDLLLIVFVGDGAYENKFDSISAMSDICLYAKKQNISLRLDELKEWRKKHDDKNASLEILECVDDILLD